MMAKRPEDRFQTPAALSLGLMPFARGASVSSALPRLKGAPPVRQRDQTPMPTALGGRPGETLIRLPRAGLQRGGNRANDTCFPGARDA
jgi:hypothetical protein